MRTPLWPELIKRLAERNVRKVKVISPFYDQELGFLHRLREQWPAAALTIVAQPDYATLDGKRLGKLFGSGDHRLLSASPQPGRRLHAKAFSFETDAETYWLSGSPNATLAAFDGRNTEAALWVSTEENADTLLGSCELELEIIDPVGFKGAAEQEPRNESARSRQLTLGSAVLHESGALDCELEATGSIVSLSLRVRNVNEELPVLSLLVRRTIPGKVSIELNENQIAQIRGAAICEVKGVLPPGREVISNAVALVQLYQLLRDRPVRIGGRDPLRKIEETGENLVSYVDSLGSVREAVEFFNNCSIRFFDGESPPNPLRRDLWKPRDPFKPDTPPNWLNVAVGGSVEDLRNAIRDFVERHQRQKLYKHVRRGNLNGLPNFLDIFRTLNGLLLTYNHRVMGNAGAVIPFGVVTTSVITNLELLIGPLEQREDAYEGDGFVSAIYVNMAGESAKVRERLREERVPQMLRAAVEAMINVRAKARKMAALDPWAMNRLRWVSEWISAQGLDQPTADDVRSAGLEYLPEQKAA